MPEIEEVTETVPNKSHTKLQTLIKKAKFDDIKNYINENDDHFQERYTFYCKKHDKFDYKDRHEDSVVFMAIDLPEKTKNQNEIIDFLLKKDAKVYEFEQAWLECYTEKRRMEKRIEELQPQIDEINQKVKDKKEDYERNLKNLEDEYNELKDKNDTIIAENETLDREIASLEAEYNRKIEQGKAELQRKENDEIIPKLTRQKARIEELEGKIKEKQEETVKIQEEVKVIEADKAYLEEEINKQRSSMNPNQLKEYENAEEIKRLEDELSDLKLEHERLAEDLHRAREVRSANLKQETKSADKIKKLKAQISEAEQALEISEQQYEERKKIFDDLQKDKKKIEKENEELLQQCRTLEAMQTDDPDGGKQYFINLLTKIKDKMTIGQPKHDGICPNCKKLFRYLPTHELKCHCILCRVCANKLNFKCVTEACQ